MAAYDNYVLQDELQVPLTGNAAGLSIVNLNIGITVSILVHHRTYGSETFDLTQAGATLNLPLDGIDAVTITATSYPATILYVQTAVPSTLSTPQSFAGASGGGATVNVETVGLSGSFLSTVVTMTGAAVPVPAAILANRRGLTLQAAPDNTSTIYVGGSTVTADEASTGGIQLAAGATLTIGAGSAIVYAIGAAGQKLIVLEGA